MIETSPHTALAMFLEVLSLTRRTCCSGPPCLPEKRRSGAQSLLATNITTLSSLCMHPVVERCKALGAICEKSSLMETGIITDAAKKGSNRYFLPQSNKENQ